jgi:hypothetical protein
MRGLVGSWFGLTFGLSWPMGDRKVCRFIGVDGGEEIVWGG